MSEQSNSISESVDAMVDRNLLADNQAILTKKLLGSEAVCVSASDEIWLVSARSSHLTPCEPSMLEVCQLQNGCWKNAHLTDVVSRHAEDHARATMVFVHGNGFDLEWCKARGLQLYKSAFQNVACRPPLRLILFCWKSEIECVRPIPDFKIKSQRSVILGITFSQFLEQFPNRNMLICTYSLGAQVVVKSLEQSDPQSSGCAGYRVAMLAPAFDADYVCGCFPSFSDSALVARTEVFVNRKDRSIKIAKMVVRKNCRHAIPMLAGWAQTNPLAANPIRITDISTEVNSCHLLGTYASSSTVQARLAELLNEVTVSSPALTGPTPALQRSASKPLIPTGGVLDLVVPSQDQ